MTLYGIDLIKNYSNIFNGKRIGLITNFSGIASNMQEDLEVFKSLNYNVSKVFTPEHGLYAAHDGENVDSFIHPIYGIPVISLYGEKNMPSSTDLDNLDILVYDIQDVGLRYYTYIYTLANCMKAAANKGLPLVVLDRPNPLGDSVSGNTMKKENDSFVGAYGLCIRYGLTVGELGFYFKDYLDLKLDYSVIKMKNYEANFKWPDTLLPFNIPSPSIHTFNTCLCYNGGCFFEATNISEGRGTAIPFQFYGAPFVEEDKFIKELRLRIKDDNLVFRSRAFTPFWSKHAGLTCFGVEFMPLNNNLDFTYHALTCMKTFKDMYPDKFEFKSYADVARLTSLSGDETAMDYLNDKLSLNALKEKWQTESEQFAKDVKQFRLY